MTTVTSTSPSANPAENYERYFVPAIGAPLAQDLVQRAALRPGERVLDVACGTGVVARFAAEQVGSSGAVAGADIHPAMLSVARAATPPGVKIDWYETGAEAMPLPDARFDVVFCQMGLQFMSDRGAALREMHRVLTPGGRLLVNTPGPAPAPFGALAELLAAHINPKAGAFAERVFALHDRALLEELLVDAGFEAVSARRERKALPLPAPEAFLWQYVYSTPLAAPVSEADEAQRSEFEHALLERWREHVAADGGLALDLEMSTAQGAKPA